MSDCVRTAWLDLYGDGTVTKKLEDQTAGYFCTELNLGFPAIREVTDNNPDRNGTTDRTRLWGSRAVSANITALAGARAIIDQVAADFAPYMLPDVRPVLHYILDRPNAPERTLTLRAAGYAAPIAGPYERDLQLQWVAPDPIAYGAAQQEETALAGTPTSPGRVYNLTFNRIYPPGSGAPSTAILSSPGQIGVHPHTRIYGPITQPQLIMQRQPDGTSTQFNFIASFVLSAGQWVDIDSANRTVFLQGDPTRNAAASVDWSTSSWPYIPPQPKSILLRLTGQSTSVVTQAVVTWNDAYLL